MKLSAYLRSVDKTPAQFAEIIGCSRQAVERYCNGERIPRPVIMARIISATGNRVGPTDFYASPLARAA